jgi:hypothetical protein
MTTTSNGSGDPFRVLGLPASAELSDERVRAAWRAIATSTHPDRPGGGDAARYGAASAAYATLRTPWGRSEAYADLTGQHIPPPLPHAATPARARVPMLAAIGMFPARLRHGRPRRLALRILAAALAVLITAVSGAGTPAIAAVYVGIATWLVLTGRGDLAPPPGR